MRLSELTAGASRLALVGLAKNTGKTVALTALLGELEQLGQRVGVTSVGRDGEARDVIDERICKPRVRLPAASIVATTDALLNVCGIPYEILEDTHVRTPLGRVLIARLREAGEIEIAGPSAGADVRAVSAAMLGHGAERVLIDGAIDRRAASSPRVSDGLVLCTGAVLGAELDEVVARTRDAVELVRLSPVEDARLRRLAQDSTDGARPDAPGGALLVDGSYDASELGAGFVLGGDEPGLAALLSERQQARWLLVRGALPEPFLQALARVVRCRRRPLGVVVADSTHVFLSERPPGWYARQGVELRVLEPITLQAVTVNPVAPRSHRLDSAELRARLERSLNGVPVLDVLGPGYRGTGTRPADAARSLRD